MRLRFSLCPLVVLLWSCTSLQAQPSDSLLIRARLLFYASVEQEKQIAPAIALFEEIGARDEKLRGRTQTYIGALQALRAKHVLWPQDKWRFANEGLKLMDEGLKLAPQDIEALFVHGTTCFYLPIFFGRSDDAQRDLREIARLLPKQHQNYDPALVLNVIDFVLQNIRLNKLEKSSLVGLQEKLTSN